MVQKNPRWTVGDFLHAFCGVTLTTRLKSKSVKPFADEVNGNTCCDSYNETTQQLNHLLRDGFGNGTVIMIAQKIFVAKLQQLDRKSLKNYNQCNE